MLISLALWTGVIGAFLIPGFNQQNIRFCMLSQSTNLQSQCILCNQQKYNTALNGCTRQNTLPPNITQQEAFCILAACIDNPRQTPITLGKRKKRDDDVPGDSQVVEDQVAHVVMEDYDLEDEDTWVRP